MNSETHRRHHFIGGLPRSGSTVLCNILAQNPRFRCDGVTSRLLDILVLMRDKWAQIPQFQAGSSEATQERVMKAIFHSYYADRPHPVVFDKHRGWLAHLEMAETLIGQKAKVILTVRDMKAIMASWEKIWRRSKNLAGSGMPLISETTVEERVRHWSSPGEPTGFAYLAIQDAIHRGFEDRLLFVDYDRLTRSPREQMQRIYRFLGEEEFRHDFDHIEQKHLEKDPEAWMKDLHLIRQKLEPPAEDWARILGPAVERLSEANQLWNFRI